MTSKNNLSVVFDIGTSKIAALVGQKNENGKMEVLATANVLSKGVKRGVIFNIEEAAISIKTALGKLEEQIDEKIVQADVAFTTQHVNIKNQKLSRLTSGDGIVTKNDILELYKEALSFNAEQNFKILHVIPQAFVIDDEIAEQNPVGISGKKIEAHYKIITVPEIQLANIKRVFDKVGVNIGEILLSTLALVESVLTEEEKEVGAIVLDIGAGTTKLAACHDGIVLHTAVIPFGGNVITNDIKEGYSIHLKWAEDLKSQFGEALGDFVDDKKYVTIPGINGWEPKEISFKSLAFIIQARLEEIIESVNYQIEKSEIGEKLGSGIVVTGGTSQLNNIISLIKFKTGFDARIAFPVVYPIKKDEEFKGQEFFTALGLLKKSLDKYSSPDKPVKKKKKKEGRFSPWFNGVVQGVIDYFDDDDGTEMKWNEKK